MSKAGDYYYTIAKVAGPQPRIARRELLDDQSWKQAGMWVDERILAWCASDHRLLPYFQHRSKSEDIQRFYCKNMHT